MSICAVIITGNRGPTASGTPCTRIHNGTTKRLCGGLQPPAYGPAVSPPLPAEDRDGRVDLWRCPAGLTGAELAVGSSDPVALLDQAALLATFLPVLASHSSCMCYPRWAGSAVGAKACHHGAAGRSLWSGLIDVIPSLPTYITADGPSLMYTGGRFVVLVRARTAPGLLGITWRCSIFFPEYSTVYHFRPRYARCAKVQGVQRGEVCVLE